jgi:hypothetical protein
MLIVNEKAIGERIAAGVDALQADVIVTEA